VIKVTAAAWSAQRCRTTRTQQRNTGAT